MADIITADRPMSIEELRRLAPHRAVLMNGHASTGEKVKAMKAYGPMVWEMAIKHGLPKTGGKYNMVAVDGQIYLQWWSDEFVASFQE